MNEAPRNVAEPEAGFYQLRQAKGAPWSAVELRYTPPNDPLTGEPLDRSWRLFAYVNGVRDEDSERVHALWPYLRKASKARHDYLVATYQWALHNAPRSPEANPHKRTTPRQAPAPAF